MLENHRDQVLKDLQALGLVINFKKSQLEPTQKVQHLGFFLNFKAGQLQVPSEKLKSVRKELGKLVTQYFLTCRKMAAILGTVRSFLTALPFLRAFTDQMRAFVSLQQKHGWDQKLPTIFG